MQLKKFKEKDLIRFMLPEGLLDYFDIVLADNQYHIPLEEKNIHPEQFKGMRKSYRWVAKNKKITKLGWPVKCVEPLLPKCWKMAIPKNNYWCEASVYSLKEDIT